MRGVLAVSIEPQRKILEELVDGRYQVVTMLAQGANPETYDPTVRQKMMASKADAYFKIGYLPFEDNITSDLPKSVRIYNTSDGVTPVVGTHSHGADEKHQETDPHVWSSLTNGKIIASNMADALGELDPDSAKVYRKRLARMTQRYDSLNRAARNRIAEAGMPAFAVWHPSLSYFARDYGVEQIVMGQENKEATIGNIASMIAHAKEDTVRVFFYQREYDSRQAESVSQEIGARLVPIAPLDYEWETEIMRIAHELSR